MMHMKHMKLNFREDVVNSFHRPQTVEGVLRRWKA